MSELIRCDFCAKTNKEAELLINQFDRYICDECVKASMNIVAEHTLNKNKKQLTNEILDEVERRVKELKFGFQKNHPILFTSDVLEIINNMRKE